jgi:L-amino acid N-acyltransferase YncA
MSTEIILRPCLAADLDAVTAIYAHHVRTGTASFETEPPDAAEMGRRHAAMLADGFVYLVAIAADGALAGYAYANAYRARAAYRDTLEDSVYLRPDLAGQGLGGRLLQAVIDESAARGFRQMIAVVGDSANLPSVRLHQRLGFRMVGTLRSVGFKHGRWLDTVLLQRALGPGDDAPPTRA